MVRGIFAVLLAVLIMAHTAVAQTPNLPQQMGSINDYAATLGIEDRQQIANHIDRLINRGNLNVVLLISRLDPFSHPPTFADAIWSEWDLAEDRTLLLIYVSEESSWRFHWKASLDVRSVIEEVADSEDFQRVSRLVNDRRIADAAIQALSTLDSVFVVPEVIEPPIQESLIEDPTSVSEDQLIADDETNGGDVVVQGEFPVVSESIPLVQTQSNSNTLLYIAGGVIVALILFLLVKIGLSGMCPDCGARLEKRTDPFSRPQFHRRSSRRGFGKQVYYACPNCRYQRAG